MSRKFYRLLVFGFVLLSSIFNCFSQTNQIVAKVNNGVITSDDLEKYSQMLLSKNDRQALAASKEELKKEALNRLIEDRLILQEAKKEEIEVPPVWLENKIKQLISRHPSQEAFYESLEEQGITMSYLKERLREQYLMKEIIDQNVRAKVVIAPGEINQCYQENQEDFQSRCRVSFFIAKDANKSVLENIKNFIETEGITKAKEKYKNELTKIDSYLDQLQKPLEQALKMLKDDKTSITKINDLYYLIYRQEIELPRMLTLSEVQDQVYKYLWQRRFSKEFNQWVDSLREDAVIKVYSSPDFKNN